MKKIISLIGATSLSVSPIMAVVSCKCIDTVKKSINNKLAEVMASTSNYFKGAILANSEGYNGQFVDKYIAKLKVSDITNNSKDSTAVSKLFETFFDTAQANKYLETEIYTRTEFDMPVQENEFTKVIAALQKSYNEVYKLIGVSFDPTLWNTALPLFLNSLSNKNILSVQKVMLKFSKSLDIMKDVKVPNYKELMALGIKSNLDLKINFSYQLTLFAANLFNIKIENTFNFNEKHEDINLDYYKYNSNIWEQIIKSLKSENEKPEIVFTSESLGLLMNALFGINWYIQNFTTDEYNLNSEDMLDDNHIFSQEKTNLEVVKEINLKNIDKDIIDATNIDGLLQFIYDLFSGETDKKSYKLLRTFKILFQVDDNITTGNTNLNFNQKVLKINEKTMSFRLGDWSSNSKTENGGLNTFLSSTLDGVVRAFAAKFGPDGEIINFLNKIGLGSEQISGVISGLISSVLTGIDMDHFFETFIDQINTSLENLLKWSFIKRKTLADQIKSAQNDINYKLKPIIDKLINSEGSFTNKFLGFLVNTDIRKLMEIFELENSLPIQLPVISLKQLVDIQLTNEIKLSDLLRMGTKGVSYLIALLSKGVAPKLVNIANAFNDTSLLQDTGFKMVHNIATEVKISNLITEPELLMGDEGKQYTYLLALASKLFSKNNTGIKVTIPGKKKFGLSKLKKFSSSQAAKWMLGLGVELDNGIIDWSQFREGTILYSIGTLWNDETGNLIKGLLGGIYEILKTLVNIFDDKQNKSYLKDLNYTHFNTKLISYENFRNNKQDSKVIYEINYKNAGTNNTYLVNLLFSGSDENEFNTKYQIEYFGVK